MFVSKKQQRSVIKYLVAQEDRFSELRWITKAVRGGDALSSIRMKDELQYFR